MSDVMTQSAFDRVRASMAALLDEAKEARTEHGKRLTSSIEPRTKRLVDIEEETRALQAEKAEYCAELARVSAMTDRDVLLALQPEEPKTEQPTVADQGIGAHRGVEPRPHVYPRRWTAVRDEAKQQARDPARSGVRS